MPTKNAGPSPDSAQRVHAGVLLAAEQAAELPKPEKPAPAPQPPKEPAQEGQGIEPLQTFRADVARVVSGTNASAVSIAAAEAKAQTSSPQPQAPEDSTKHWKAIAMVSGGIFLLSLAAAAIVYVATREAPTVAVAEIPVAPFLYIDNQRVLTLPPGIPQRGALMAQLAEARTQSDLQLGLIDWLVMAEKKEDGSLAQVHVRTILSTLSPRIPGELLRTFDGAYLLGVHSFDENQPFLLIHTDSYETAFAGMLEWEKWMQEDLSPLFTRSPSPPIPAVPALLMATSSATTTPQASPTPVVVPPRFIDTSFVDRVVENRDIRAIIDKNNHILLMWTMLTRNLILITTNEYTLREVIKRTNTAPIVPTPGR